MLLFKDHKANKRLKFSSTFYFQKINIEFQLDGLMIWKDFKFQEVRFMEVQFKFSVKSGPDLI